MTRVLVLGGTRHVGRCVVESAVARGWDVTTVNRGTAATEPSAVSSLRADRLSPGDLEGALAAHGTWDVVVDTWSGAPDAVAEGAALLAPRVGVYAYVSSISVYRWPWPLGVDERSATVDVAAGVDGSSSDDGDEADDYAARKRRSELAVIEHVGADRSLLARAGLIVGPYEQVGRLPWWLRLVAAGGRIPAPGPPDRPVQWIDGRDLADWLLTGAETGARGAVNTVGPAGMTTMGAVLQAAIDTTGSAAVLDWLTPQQVADTGIEPWSELPIWTPPEGELAAIHAIGTARAQELGLTCRPAEQTVADTWAWLQEAGYPPSLIPPAEARWTTP